MEFLRELNESRMFRRLKQLTGQSVHDVAERLFEHLLFLQILAQENPSRASIYAREIMAQQQFDGFRTSRPDLYNLIALITNQDTYSYIINTDESVGIPIFRLRRNLRLIEQRKFNNNDYSQMMYMLQQRFDQLPARLFVLRRQISNWSRLSKTEKQSVLKQLKYQMRERGIQSDFFVELEKLQ
jgi:hypothetical protein